MKYFLSSIWMFLASPYALGLELTGAWKEDVAKTIEWNYTYRVVEEEYLEKLSAVAGHLYVSYSDGEMCIYTEAHNLTYKGKSTKIEPIFIKSTYHIVAENKFGFVLKSEIDGKPNIEMLIFESEKSMYGVPLTTEDYGQPGLRMYFKKVVAPNEVVSCGQ